MHSVKRRIATYPQPLWLVPLLCVVLPCAALAETRDVPQLENDWLRLRFDSASGSLAEFTDLSNGHAFVDPAQPGELWRIDVAPLFSEIRLTPDRATRFAWERPEGGKDELRLAWEGFDVKEAPGLRVVATVSLEPGEPVVAWRMTIDGADGISLAGVRFPRVVNITEQEDEVLAAPIWMGQKMARPRRILCGEKPRSLAWETPGLLSLQCVAFYRDNGPGLYVAADDTQAFAKRFGAFGDPEGSVGLEVVHLPRGDAAAGGQYETPYRTLTGAFEGDWFTVAERYRAWALDQHWAKDGRLNSGAVADWVVDTGLWIWNRGRSENVLEPAIALHERTGIPVSVFWHWWHGCPYDVGFPEYLPPRQGADSFRDAVQQARDAGVNAIVYMNQRLWGMTTESWKEQGAERYAVKGLDGAVRPEVYNTFTKSPCASMCMGTPFWRNTYAGLAEEAVVDLGVSGIYMDQACSSLACYDPTHGHPLGGGQYWINGFRTLQADIRDRTRATRQVVLAGEGCGEAWLPYLDLMLSLQVSMDRYAAPGAWEPIPFFHAVYHGHAAFFGNYCSLTMPPYDDLWPAEFAPKEPLKLLDRIFTPQFRLEQARAFAWGQQPSLANFRVSHFDERAEEIDYVVGLARLYLQARKYLLYGMMLKPPVVGVPEQELDISRLSIYAGQQGALSQYRKKCPAILASAWQAADGDVCVVVANVSDAPQEFVLSLNPDDYPIAAESRVIVLGSDTTVATDSTDGKEVTLSVSLAPTETRVYEFK